MSDPDLNPFAPQFRERCLLHKTSIRIRAAVRMRPPMMPTSTIAKGSDAEKKKSKFKFLGNIIFQNMLF
jgi:hypothetical protein